MNTNEFINFANDFTGKNIKIYKPENDLKYSSYYPYNGELKINTKYGISFGDYIVFNFITGKNVDNFFKTFVTQYINKYAVKQMVFLDNGEYTYMTKLQCIEKIKNSDRVNKNYFYTTLYGIGCFCYFMRKTTLNSYSDILSNYLKSKNIDFKNEFSEAGWVYRFCINKNIELHNELLTNFEF
jgi:hypothetical protein